MAKCEVCGNEYDKAFELITAGARHTFDSFECAIQAIAPRPSTITDMKNSSTNVPYVECPYCDGENAVARIKSDGTAHNLSQCEIACTHCQSLFRRFI